MAKRKATRTATETTTEVGTPPRAWTVERDAAGGRVSVTDGRLRARIAWSGFACEPVIEPERPIAAQLYGVLEQLAEAVGRPRP